MSKGTFTNIPAGSGVIAPNPYPAYSPNLMVQVDQRSLVMQTLQGAMLLRAGLALDHPSFVGSHARAMGIPAWLRASINDPHRNRVMDAAWAIRDLSLFDIACDAVRLDGRQPSGSRSNIIQAAFSGGALGDIFTTSANAQLLAAYDEGEDTTEEWCQETEVENFKENELHRLTKGQQLKQLPRGGTADHMSRSSVMETFKIARYAGQFSVDEQDIIDDSLGALEDQPAEMGQICSNLRPDLVYSILSANPPLRATGRPLFNVTDGNLTGSAALASDTLSAAIARIRLQQENGRSLNFQPTHLICPPTLEDLTINLTESEFIVFRGTTDAEKGNVNYAKRRGIKMVSDPRLENGVFDPKNELQYSGSQSTWYLACAKAQTITVAYRRGTDKAPQVRRFPLSQGRWGICWDVSMDIGAVATDFRGLQQMQAAAL